MEYISRVRASHPRFKTQPYYSPALLGGGFGISNIGLQELATDRVQFGINRAQKSKAAKQKNVNLEKDRKRGIIRSIEEEITTLYDQGLPTTDKKAFQIKVMEILGAHPELSMNISLRFDLENKKLPAIPLLHFALAHKYFTLAEYILQRDSKKNEIDYTQRDFKQQTAAQIAQLVFETSQEYGSDNPDENTEICQEYANRIALNSFKYEQLHPEKRTNTITILDEPPASSPILLRNFSHHSWKQFLKEELGRDVSSDEDSPDDSKARTSQVPGSSDSANKVNSKPASSSNSTAQEKKPKLSRRQQVAQAEKKRKQDEITRSNREQAKQATKLEAAAKLSVERQKLEEKRLAAINKAWALNARLEAIPKMQLYLEWKPEITESAEPPETDEAVKTDEKATSKAQPDNQQKLQQSQQNDKHTESSQPVSQNMAQPELQSDKTETFKAPSLHSTPVPPSKKIVPAVPHLRPDRSESNKQFLKSTSDTQPSQSRPEQKAPQDKKHRISSTSTTSAPPNAFMPESEGKGYFTSPTPLTPVTDDKELLTTHIDQFSLDETAIKPGKGPHQAKIKLPLMPKSPSQYSCSTESSLSETSRTFSQSSHTTGITQFSLSESISASDPHRKARKRSSKIAALKRNLEEKQQLLNQASAASLQNQQTSFRERQNLLDQAIREFNLAHQEYLKNQKLEWEKQQVQWERDNARIEKVYWQNEAHQRSISWANYTASIQNELNVLRAAFNAKRQGIFQEQRDVLMDPNMSMNSNFYDPQWVERIQAQEQAIQGLENLQTQIQGQETEIEKNYIPCRGGSDGNSYGYRVKDPCGKAGVWPGSWVPDR